MPSGASSMSSSMPRFRDTAGDDDDDVAAAAIGDGLTGDAANVSAENGAPKLKDGAEKTAFAGGAGGASLFWSMWRSGRWFQERVGSLRGVSVWPGGEAVVGGGGLGCTARASGCRSLSHAPLGDDHEQARASRPQKPGRIACLRAKLGVPG